MKTIRIPISILLFVSSAFIFASCKKTPAPVYYYPAPYSEAAQVDIGDNLSWGLLLESRWFDTKINNYMDFSLESFAERREQVWSPENAPDWERLYTFRETGEDGIPTNKIGIISAGELIESVYYEFIPETQVLSYISGDKILNNYIPVPDIASVRASGIVLESPVYIGTPADFGNSLDGIANVAKSYSDADGSDTIWIYLPDGIPEVRIITLSRDIIEETYTESGELLAVQLQSGEILEYTTQMPDDNYPLVAFVFYGENRQTQYPYILQQMHNYDMRSIYGEMLNTTESGNWSLKQ